MLLGMVIMSVHQQGYNHLRLSNIKDIEYLAPRLRFEDKREILSALGITPYAGLHFSYKNSTACFTIVNSKNIPLAIFGVNKNNSSIWLMATEGLKEVEKPFLKQCRELVNFLANKHKILWNYVDCRNELHIKWLKWCGFKFLRKVNYGVLNQPFYEIIKICA
jgi:hypothetical protein